MIAVRNPTNNFRFRLVVISVLMSVTSLSSAVFVPRIAIAQSDEKNSGDVAYVFDGGSVILSYLRSPIIARRVVIAYPRDDQRNKDAVVYIVDSDTPEKRVYLNEENLAHWEAELIQDIQKRNGSVAEHGFIAAVSYSVRSNQKLSSWGSQAVSFLERGCWCELFRKGHADTAESGRSIEATGADVESINPFSSHLQIR